MAEFKPILLCLLLLTWSVSATETAPKDEEKKEEKEELLETETRDGKLEIIKKIKKINVDGSYTIGYEADDGSFKIESRDVLGHIKGTYGFVDEDGNLKRVSYSSGNATETPGTTSARSAGTTTARYPGTSSTRSPPSVTTDNVVQSIAKRRSTTSRPPNYTDVVNVYSSTQAPMRVLLHGRPSEGQLARPDVVTVKPTQLPALKTLTLRRLEDEKPVHEDLEQRTHGTTNILRRQLGRSFDAREEASRLRQSIGHDDADVYSSSMTTGHPKPPLFTTTARPRLIPVSTTPIPVSVARPYPIHYQNSQLVEVTPSAEPQQTTQVPRFPVPQVPRYPPPQAIPSPAPVVQIPATREEPEQLVAVRHHKGTVLVPISHLQGRLVPLEDVYQPEQKVVEIEQHKAIVRKLPPPQLRPIPVQVDEDGYIREVARPYQVPIPSEFDNDVDGIQPPVSTRDFHKLLQQLILRQSRLEKISALTKQPEVYLRPQQRTRPIYRIEEPARYVHHQRQQPSFEDHYESYRPNRRVARLQPHLEQPQQRDDEYLPSNVREMLLLRMLQLAINPALPVDGPQEAMDIHRKPMRNVEILGEEQEPMEGRRRRSGKSRVYEKVY